MSSECAVMNLKFSEYQKRIEELKTECERLWGIVNESSVQLAKERAELARWQKLARGDRARMLMMEYNSWHESPKDLDDFMEQATQELGIPSSEHVSDNTKMMLTKEQRAALEAAIDMISEPCDCGYKGQERVIDILQAMLSQSSHAWEITEERREAIEVVVDTYDLSEIVPYLPVLRVMLGEAKCNG